MRCAGRPTDSETAATALLDACDTAPERIAEALAVADFRPALAALRDIVDEANRYVDTVRPWQLAKAAGGGDTGAAGALDAALGNLLYACRVLGAELTPFLPGAAARIVAVCDGGGGRLPVPVKVFGSFTTSPCDETGSRGR